MYSLSENQKQTILFSLERISVTGPDQGALLFNVANIIRNLERVPDKKEGDS